MLLSTVHHSGSFIFCFVVLTRCFAFFFLEKNFKSSSWQHRQNIDQTSITNQLLFWYIRPFFFDVFFYTPTHCNIASYFSCFFRSLIRFQKIARKSEVVILYIACRLRFIHMWILQLNFIFHSLILKIKFFLAPSPFFFACPKSCCLSFRLEKRNARGIGEKRCRNRMRPKQQSAAKTKIATNPRLSDWTIDLIQREHRKSKTNKHTQNARHKNEPQ